MTEIVLNISRAGYTGVLNATQSAGIAYRKLGFASPSRTMLILASIMIALQVLDGILTGIGVAHFGTSIEGNFLIRVLMENFGCISALIVVKSAAILVVMGLCALSSSVRWLPSAMKAVIALYMVAAIIPWTAIVFSRII